jgi:hypothetical protein
MKKAKCMRDGFYWAWEREDPTKRLVVVEVRDGVVCSHGLRQTTPGAWQFVEGPLVPSTSGKR